MFKNSALNNLKEIYVTKNGKNFLALSAQSLHVQSPVFQTPSVQVSRVQPSRSCAQIGGETIRRPFPKNSKLSVTLDQ